MKTSKQIKLNKQISQVERSINNRYQKNFDSSIASVTNNLNKIYTCLDPILKMQVSLLKWFEFVSPWDDKLDSNHVGIILRDDLVECRSSVEGLLDIFHLMNDDEIFHLTQDVRQLARDMDDCIFELSNQILRCVEEEAKLELLELRAEADKAIQDIQAESQRVLDNSKNIMKEQSHKAFSVMDEDIKSFYSELSERKTEWLSITKNSIGDLLAARNEGELTISQAVKNQQLIFTETIDKEISSFKSELGEQRSNIVNNIEELVGEELKRSKKKIDNHVADFKSVNAEVHSLLEISSSDVLANNHLQQAKDEKKIADFLRLSGFIFLAAATIFACFEINKLIDKAGEISIMFVFVRLLIIFLLTTPAIYILKESSRHRSDERKYRNIGIQLATVNSYLDSFSAVEKGQIKKDLTASFFGNSEAKVDTSSVPEMQKIVEKLIDTIASVKK